MADEVFYTLRKAGMEDRPTYMLAKWDGGYSLPLDVYVQWIVKRAQGLTLQSCNCPSRSHPCKHERISLDLMNSPSPLHTIFWLDGEVHKAYDIPELDDVRKA